MDQNQGTIQNDPAASPANLDVGTPIPGTGEPAGNDAPSTGDDAKGEVLSPEQQRDADEKVKGDRAKQRINDRFREFTTTIKDKDLTIKQKDEIIARLAAGGRLPQQAQDQVSDPEPKRDDPRWQGMDYEEFLDARSDWRARKAYREEKAADDRKAAEQARERHIGETVFQTVDAHNKRLDAYAKANPDFVKLMNETDVQIDEAVGFLVQRNEDGPLLVHELARQPELAARLNRCKDVLEAQELLGRIAGAAKARTSQVTKARESGDPVNTKPSSEGEAPEDTEAYMKWANKKFGNKPRKW